jgi:hypothetical protein
VAAPPDNEATYANSTGITGRQRRRRIQCTQKQQQRTHASLTPDHPHHTRSNKRVHFAAATPTVPSPPIATAAASFDHFALHGNAFNPDTGQLADYIELSKCSEGALWIESCKDEFG